MFCSQCGNRVPDGSRFCGLCGTKISVDVDAPAIQRTQRTDNRYSQSTAFDWSGVKGEPHKKYARDVVSPWGSTGMPEEPVQEKQQQEPEQQRSRTMSFIDILKKEREEKALEEEATAAREAEEARMARAKSTPSVYVPPVYDDVSSPVITPFDAPMYSITEQQQYSVPRATRPEITIPPVTASTTVEIPRMTQQVEYSNLVDERYHETPAVRPSADYVEANKARLTAELSSILDGGNTVAAAARNTAEDRYADNRDLTDMYLSMEQSRTARAATPRSHAAPVYDEPAPMYNEPAPTYNEPAPAYNRPAPAYNNPAPQTSAVGSNTAEIEALKARLAELMGVSITGQVEMPKPEIVDPIIEPPMVETVPQQVQPVQEPVREPVQEPVKPVVSEPAPQVAPEPIFNPTPLYQEPEQESLEELPLIDPTPEVEEELPLINEALEAEVAASIPEAENDGTTDAMSVKELEKDLFGEVSEEDIQAEETKKIDKFYTLYKKNEEFQRLLDEEYNKLKSESEEVPTVSAVLGEESKKNSAEASAPDKKYMTSAADLTVDAKAAQVADEEDEDDAPSKGGAALTVLAVIIAVLLVVLLAVILVLNFAPDSAIALQIDSIIETITSYFSGVDTPGRLLL